MPSDASHPSYRVAAQTLVYTLPIALGFGLLSWSVVELVSVFTDAYWVIPELFFPLIMLTLGTGLTLFGGIGALSHSLHATIGTPSEYQ